MSEETSNTPTRVGNPYLVPLAIVIAGCAIAASLYVTRATAPPAPSPAQAAAPAKGTVRPISDDDHVFGSRDADVFLIEYSDYQCPFCERFHTTVKEALKQYDGKVAWVYRHLPLDGLHPEARPAAIASECVAQLGGNDAFWDFTDKIFEDQRAMGAARYRAIVGELGLDQAAFDACVADGSVEDRVNADSDNAQELGGNGTPFNVLLTKNGKSRNFSGALPLANVKVLIDSALRSAQQ